MCTFSRHSSIRFEFNSNLVSVVFILFKGKFARIANTECLIIKLYIYSFYFFEVLHFVRDTWQHWSKRSMTELFFFCCCGFQRRLIRVHLPHYLKTTICTQHISWVKSLTERILSGILMTWPTPDQGLCKSPKYLNLSSSPCISFISANSSKGKNALQSCVENHASMFYEMSPV